METIKEGSKVKFIGETNYYIFKYDLSTNSIGNVKNVIDTDRVTTYQVEFDNGIIASVKANYYK